MCRGGRRFAPTKTWRKWHVKINLNEKRYAIASAVAATAVPSLVLARGHRIEEVNEIPLVIGDGHFNDLAKTKEAVALLRGVNAYRDILKVNASRKLRAGKGKMRNRRHRQRLGPLIIHDSESPNLVRSFRNIPGIETANVNSLNLLQLAPGGHLGRFVIWTEGAFKKLDYLYGKEHGVVSEGKSDYVLPWNVIGQSDIARVINSDEVQSVLKPKGAKVTKRQNVLKKNPLRNKYLSLFYGYLRFRQVLLRLNPYAKVFKPPGKIPGKKEKSAQEGFLKVFQQD
jgi:large subunit ribosomal protein L4e